VVLAHTKAFAVCVWILHAYGCDNSRLLADADADVYRRSLGDAAQRAFDQVDTNQSGFVDPEEIYSFMLQLGLMSGDSQDDVDQFMKLYEMMDINLDGTMSRTEFVRLMLQGLSLHGQGSGDTVVVHQARIALLSELQANDAKVKLVEVDRQHTANLRQKITDMMKQKKQMEEDLALRHKQELEEREAALQSEAIKNERPNPLVDAEEGKITYSFGLEKLPQGCFPMGALKKVLDGQHRINWSVGPESYIDLPANRLPLKAASWGHPSATTRLNCFAFTMCFKMTSMPQEEESACLFSFLAGSHIIDSSGKMNEDEDLAATRGLFVKADGAIHPWEGKDEVPESKKGLKYEHGDQAANRVMAKVWHTLTCIVDCAFGHSLHVFLDGEHHMEMTSPSWLCPDGPYSISPNDAIRLLSYSSEQRTSMLGGELRHAVLHARSFMPAETIGSVWGKTRMQKWVDGNPKQAMQLGIMSSMWHYVIGLHATSGIWPTKQAHSLRTDINVSDSQGDVGTEFARPLWRGPGEFNCPVTGETNPQIEPAEPAEGALKERLMTDCRQLCSAATAAIYPHMLPELLEKSWNRTVVVCTVSSICALEGAKLAIMKQAAQVSKRSQVFDFVCVVIDGWGYKTHVYSLATQVPSMHLFKALTEKPEKKNNLHADKTLLDLEQYKRAIEFQGPWSLANVWAFLQTCTEGMWMTDIAALSTEFNSYSKEHDIEGLSLGLVAAALRDQPPRSMLRSWASIYFGDEGVWKTQQDFQEAREASLEKLEEEGGADDAMGAGLALVLRFRYEGAARGPLSEHALFRKAVADFVRGRVERAASGGDAARQELPTSNADGMLSAEETAYIQQSGLGGLLTSLIAAMRCYQPPESLEAFLAWQLRAGLEVLGSKPATSPQLAASAQDEATGDAMAKPGRRASQSGTSAAGPSEQVPPHTPRAAGASKSAELAPAAAETSASSDWMCVVPMALPKAPTQLPLATEHAWWSFYSGMYRLADVTDDEILNQLEDLLQDGELLDCGGLTAFHAACLAGRPVVVEECLTSTTAIRRSPNLVTGVAALSLDSVPEGVDDAGVDVYSSCNVTGLELAAAANHTTVCQILLKHGALVGRALHIAVVSGSVQATEGILNSFGDSTGGALRRLLNSAVGGFTPLALAVLGNQTRLVETLLDKGADPLQKLGKLALRKLAFKPCYTSGLTSFDQDDECTVLHFALRLGAGKRRLWDMMLQRLLGSRHLALSMLTLDGTAVARSIRPFFLPSTAASGTTSVHTKFFPQAVWKLLPQAGTPAVAAEIGHKFVAIQGLLLEQLRALREKEAKKKGSEEAANSDEKEDILGLGSLVEFEEEEAANQQDLRGFEQLMSAARAADGENVQSNTRVLPWHLLADSQGWDPVAVCAFLRSALPDALEGLLDPWRAGLDRDVEARVAQMRAEGAKDEDIAKARSLDEAGLLMSRDKSIGICFWAKLLRDHELEGVFLKYRLHTSDFEEKAFTLVQKGCEKLNEELKTARDEAAAARQRLDEFVQNQQPAVAEDGGEDAVHFLRVFNEAKEAQTKEAKQQEARAKHLALALEVFSSLGAGDRKPEVFFNAHGADGPSASHEVASETSFPSRMRSCIEGMSAASSSSSSSAAAPPGGSKTEPPAPVVDGLIGRLLELELPCELDDERPTMKGLVSRAKLFAIATWASLLASTEAADFAFDVLWRTFVLRLWSADDRIPSQCFAPPDQGGDVVLQDLLWYVRQATLQLSEEKVLVFGYLPPNALLKASAVAGAGGAAARRMSVGTAMAVKAPTTGRFNMRPDLTLLEGGEVHLPPLSALTADPSMTWDMCQRHEGGVVFKIHARSARPTWQASICPEEREYTLGPQSSVRLIVRSVRVGVSSHDLFRGLDFATRTFGASQMLPLPFRVYDGLTAFDEAQGLHKVIFVEAEELPEGGAAALAASSASRA